MLRLLRMNTPPLVNQTWSLDFGAILKSIRREFLHKLPQLVNSISNPQIFDATNLVLIPFYCLVGATIFKVICWPLPISSLC